MAASMQRDNLATGARGRRRAKRRPLLHYAAAFLDQIRSCGCDLGRVAEVVAERDLEQFTRRVGPLATPVTEGRAEAVHREAVAGVPGERLPERHRDDRLGAAVDGEEVFATPR